MTSSIPNRNVEVQNFVPSSNDTTSYFYENVEYITSELNETNKYLMRKLEYRKIND